MEWEQGLERVNQLVFDRTGSSLTAVELAVLKGAWLGQSYETIAEVTNYSTSYLSRTLSPQLWRLLSDTLGESVTKKSFRASVERFVAQNDRPIIQTNQEKAPPQEAVVPTPPQSVIAQPLTSSSFSLVPFPSPTCDWGEAIDVSTFYGRALELETLEQWILQDHCRLVAILGMGGIGKTALSVKLAEQIQDHFEFVLWRSLRNSPTLENLLADLIPILSQQQEIQLTDPVSAQLYRLLHYLKQHRCLLVLDNSESVLQVGAIADYLPHYEGYGELLRRVGEENHQSCLLLTGREKLAEVATLEGKMAPVRTLQLKGLNLTETNSIFRSKGLLGSERDRQQLHQIYCGNPLALKIVATSIRELFEGNISKFLEEEIIVFNSIRLLLDQQFNRLSESEKQVMYWLAIRREWVTVPELQQDIVPTCPRVKLLETLEYLKRRSLIESNNNSFTQQAVVMEYITEALIEKMLKGLISQESEFNEFLTTFYYYALIQADAKEHIRDSQNRLILQPIANKLREALPSTAELQAQMLKILQDLRRSTTVSSNYAAGNLINLMGRLNLDLTGFDFSHLTVRQAYLQGATLPSVNFASAHFEQSVFTQTCGSIWSVAFSPDGKLLATGDTNCEICIWRVTDGQLLLTCKGHTSWVLCVAWSPDGTLLASAGNDSTLRLWDSQTGKCLYRLQDHTAWVWTVAWSPDSTLFASGSQDQTIKLWDRHTGQCIKTLSGHLSLVSTIAWSPDGKILATGSHDRTIRFWDLCTGECINTIQTDTTGVLSIAWSPDGTTLAVASYEPMIQLWNITLTVPTNLTVKYQHRLQGHTAWVASVGWSPDGQTLASASCDATIRLWHPLTGICLKTLQGHGNWVYSLAWSPNGKILASGSQDQTLRLWDRTTGQPLKIFQGYTNGCFAVNWHPDGQLLATAFQDQTIRLWHYGDQQWVQVLQGHQHLIWSITWSPDGKILATGSQDQTIKLWDMTTGKCLKTLHGHLSVVRHLAWNPAERLLASAGQDRMVKIWDVETGSCRNTVEHSDFVWSVAWSPDGRILAYSCQDRIIKLWDRLTEAYLTTLEGHTDIVYTAIWSPDGQMLASGSQDRTIKLWHVPTGTCLHTLPGHTDSIGSIAWSPDGTKFASGSHDHTIRLWNCHTGECLYTLTSHTGLIFAVAWHPIDSILISGSGDGTIKVWDPDAGQCLETLKVDRPYEAMNLAGATGLTEAQKATLKALGAIEN